MASTKRKGKQTVAFSSPPVLLAMGSIVGPKEGDGPLQGTFDKVLDNNYYGESSWEKSERKMLLESIETALRKVNLQPGDIHYLLSGDLLNQCISADQVASRLGIPFLGLYGACSTMFEGLALASMLIDGGFADRVIAATSSHYGTAERQFRFPTEQGTQRPLTAQWTVTGAAAAVLANQGEGPRITHATVGKVLDMGIKDPGDMGSAMAAAAVDTIATHMDDTGRSPRDYDLIITGDLGKMGKEVAMKVASSRGYDFTKNYTDCGVLIYDESQDTHAGGSGCACSAVVTAGYLLKNLYEGRYHRILCTGTGALLSPTSNQQGDSIPGIGHAVVIEY